MNAYTADQITLAQEILEGKHLRALALKPILTRLGISSEGKTRTQLWAEMKEKAAEIALLAPVDAEEEEEEEEDSASVSTTETAPAEEAPAEEMGEAEYHWTVALADDEARKTDYIALWERVRKLEESVRILKSIPTASPISAAPAPKAKPTKAAKAPKEAKPKAAPAARVSTKGADLSAMLEDGESVFSKELINDGDRKGEYRICEGRWNTAKKGFGLFIDGELQGDYIIKSPTTLVSAFRQMMNGAGESKQASSTTCGFAKCFVVRDGKEMRLKALLPAPATTE